jgi:hypothetical protein
LRSMQFVLQGKGRSNGLTNVCIKSFVCHLLRMLCCLLF